MNMRATTLSFLLMALCAVGPIAYAQPVKLTDSELDTLTAGAVYVSADAWALAIGDGPYAGVDTETHTGGAGFVEWGFGRATAVACCGPQTDANVSFNAFADGTNVTVVSHVIGLRGPQYATATGFIYVVSINPVAPRILRSPQDIRLLPWAHSPFIGRLIRPLGARFGSTSEDLGTAVAVATADARGLSAGAHVLTFTAAFPDFSAAAATSISFRD